MGYVFFVGTVLLLIFAVIGVQLFKVIPLLIIIIDTYILWQKFVGCNYIFCKLKIDHIYCRDGSSIALI